MGKLGQAPAMVPRQSGAQGTIVQQSVALQIRGEVLKSKEVVYKVTKRSHPMSHLLGCDMGHLLISRKFAPRGPVYPGQIPPGVPATRAGRQYIH